MKYLGDGYVIKSIQKFPTKSFDYLPHFTVTKFVHAKVVTQTTHLGKKICMAAISVQTMCF